MVSRYDMISYFENKVNNDDTKEWRYDKEADKITNKADGEVICDMDTYLKVYRKNSGQSFECIYDDHPMLWSVIRCTECGTVIFDKSDEDYDPNLKCPTCTDYQTWFKFWTKEDIEQDEEKQKVIKMYIQWDKDQQEQYERRKRRGDKYDWQLAKLIPIKNKKGWLNVEFKVDNITNKWKLKGLRVEVSWIKRDTNVEWSGTSKWRVKIPLSWSAFYIQCVYKHLGKCHPDLRSKWYVGKAREN